MISHIRSAWLPFLSRLQSVAGKQRGHAIIRMIVIVDSEGNPVIWSEPKMTKLEPVSRTSDFLEQMSKYLSD